MTSSHRRFAHGTRKLMCPLCVAVITVDDRIKRAECALCGVSMLDGEKPTARGIIDDLLAGRYAAAQTTLMYPTVYQIATWSERDGVRYAIPEHLKLVDADDLEGRHLAADVKVYQTTSMCIAYNTRNGADCLVEAVKNLRVLEKVSRADARWLPDMLPIASQISCITDRIESGSDQLQTSYDELRAIYDDLAALHDRSVDDLMSRRPAHSLPI